MGKKKKVEQPDIPRVSLRKKPYITINHKLEKSGIEIKISAKREDWGKFWDSYILKRDDFFSDFLPIFHTASKAAMPKTRHKKGQDIINALKIFAAIIFKLLSHIQKTEQYSDSLRNLRKNFDALTTAAIFMDNIFGEFIKKYHFGTIYGGIYSIKLKPFYDRAGCVNFEKTYIEDGIELIKTQDIQKPLEFINGLLWHIGFKGVYVTTVSIDSPVYCFLSNVSDALSVQFVCPESNTMKTCKDENGNRKPVITDMRFREIKLIRELLKEAIPSLPLPIPD